MSFALLLFHVLVVVDKGTAFSLRIPEHLYGVIAGSSLCILVLLSLPLLRRPSYEIFLRTHQALAVLSAYSIWRHVPSESLFPRMYIYISAGLFFSTSVVQCVSTLWRNGTFRHGAARALVTQAEDAVKIQITLSRPLRVEAGQYINLWIPSVSFWSFLQSHPFVVTSWSAGEQNQLELFVEPRRGLMGELLYHAQAGERDRAMGSRSALFSGPHGISTPVAEYESILMIASGFGMAALLPYLKQLIHGYRTRKTCTRQIRVIWQVQRIETAVAMQPLLNNALEGDNLDKILSVSIFSTQLKMEEVSYGRRGTVYRGSADVREALQAEMSKRYKHGAQRDVEAAQEVVGYVEEIAGRVYGENGKMLVMGKAFYLSLLHD
ncbi:hypothetical protein MMC13_001796 [Lambiella insularis]|nr:hypothetical protein [Lambiella insularis]